LIIENNSLPTLNVNCDIAHLMMMFSPLA